MTVRDKLTQSFTAILGSSLSQFFWYALLACGVWFVLLPGLPDEVPSTADFPARADTESGRAGSALLASQYRGVRAGHRVEWLIPHIPGGPGCT